MLLKSNRKINEYKGGELQCDCGERVCLLKCSEEAPVRDNVVLKHYGTRRSLSSE